MVCRDLLPWLGLVSLLGDNLKWANKSTRVATADGGAACQRSTGRSEGPTFSARLRAPTGASYHHWYNDSIIRSATHTPHFKFILLLLCTSGTRWYTQSAPPTKFMHTLGKEKLAYKFNLWKYVYTYWYTSFVGGSKYDNTVHCCMFSQQTWLPLWMKHQQELQ